MFEIRALAGLIVMSGTWQVDEHALKLSLSQVEIQEPVVGRIKKRVRRRSQQEGTTRLGARVHTQHL